MFWSFHSGVFTDKHTWALLVLLGEKMRVTEWPGTIQTCLCKSGGGPSPPYVQVESLAFFSFFLSHGKVKIRASKKKN